MKHLNGFNKLNKTSSHRKAMFRNMSESLISKERITTTLAKAKELRRIVEKLITKAKINNLHNIRIISRYISDKDMLMKLFNEIAPRYIDRKGGYTRIYKLGRRLGDAAEEAIIEFVEELKPVKKTKKKAKKTTENVESKAKEESTSEVKKSKKKTDGGETKVIEKTADETAE